MKNEYPISRIFKPFILAALIVAIAASMRIWPLQGLKLTIPWITFYPAVMLSALYGGFLPGLLATLLSVLTVNYWSPTDQPFLDDPIDYLGAGIFAFNCLLITAITEVMHHSRRQNIQLLEHSEAANRELLAGKQELMGFNQDLERIVAERTQMLEAANAKLQQGLISEQKRIETALKSSEEQFRTLFSIAPVAMALSSVNGDILMLNEAFIRTLGYTLADIPTIDHWWRIAYPDPEYRQQVIEHWQTIQQSAVEKNARLQADEYTVVCKNGEARNLIITGIAFGDNLLVTINDITKYKKIETELRKLSLIVEQSPESIIVTDLAAKIEYVNEAFEKISGYSREQALGKNPHMLSSGKTPHETFSRMWSTLTQGSPWKGEFINRRKDGSIYYEFASIAPLRQDGGRITHYVAVKEDVTEKKRVGAELDNYRRHLEQLVADRTEELSKAKIQAESANQAKSTFLANMSHEIRTPLNTILGLITLLRPSSTPEQLDSLDKIHNAGRHLLSVINDILDLSKIEAGKLQLEHNDFALGALLNHVHSMIANSASAKGLAVQIEADSTSAWLRGDITRLRQALLNYAGNAVKFTEKGCITLSAALLEERDGEVWIRFAVKDTGIGIDPDHIERLFDRFEQLDTSTTRKYAGTGIGLSITRHLAHLMGGETGVESTPGVGSTFWFTARLQRGKEGMIIEQTLDKEDTQRKLRENCRGARLLLAEDNAVNRKVELALLQAVGMTVETAVDGVDALKKAQTQAYDLILMDMQMPNMDGLAATHAIRALPDRKNTPILAVTANAFDEARRACEAAGMNGFISKPIDVDELYATLLRWLPCKTKDEALYVDCANLCASRSSFARHADSPE